MESLIIAILGALGLILAVICLHLVMLLKTRPPVMPDNRVSQPVVYYDPYEEALAEPKPERIARKRVKEAASITYLIRLDLFLMCVS